MMVMKRYPKRRRASGTSFGTLRAFWRWPNQRRTGKVLTHGMHTAVILMIMIAVFAAGCGGADDGDSNGIARPTQTQEALRVDLPPKTGPVFMTVRPGLTA